MPDEGRRRTELGVRIPRMVFNAVFALFFYLMSGMIPPLAKGARIPGIEIEPFNNASWLLWASLVAIAAVFAVRAIYDFAVVVDTFAGVLVEKLGPREVTPARRVLRDVTYMILVMVLAEASTLILKDVPVVGPYLSLAVSLAALFFFIILAYDIGRMVYDFVERRVDLISERIIDFAERSIRRREKG